MVDVYPFNVPSPGAAGNAGRNTGRTAGPADTKGGINYQRAEKLSRAPFSPAAPATAKPVFSTITDRFIVALGGIAYSVPADGVGQESRRILSPPPAKAADARKGATGTYEPGCSSLFFGCMAPCNRKEYGAGLPVQFLPAAASALFSARLHFALQGTAAGVLPVLVCLAAGLFAATFPDNGFVDFRLQAAIGACPLAAFLLCASRSDRVHPMNALKLVVILEVAASIATVTAVRHMGRTTAGLYTALVASAVGLSLSVCHWNLVGTLMELVPVPGIERSFSRGLSIGCWALLLAAIAATNGGSRMVAWENLPFLASLVLLGLGAASLWTMSAQPWMMYPLRSLRRTKQAMDPFEVYEDVGWEISSKRVASQILVSLAMVFGSQLMNFAHFPVYCARIMPLPALAGDPPVRHLTTAVVPAAAFMAGDLFGRSVLVHRLMPGPLRQIVFFLGRLATFICFCYVVRLKEGSPLHVHEVLLVLLLLQGLLNGWLLAAAGSGIAGHFQGGKERSKAFLVANAASYLGMLAGVVVLLPALLSIGTVPALPRLERLAAEAGPDSGTVSSLANLSLWDLQDARNALQS